MILLGYYFNLVCVQYCSTHRNKLFLDKLSIEKYFECFFFSLFFKRYTHLFGTCWAQWNEIIFEGALSYTVDHQQEQMLLFRKYGILLISIQVTYYLDLHLHSIFLKNWYFYIICTPSSALLENLSPPSVGFRGKK